MSSVLRSKYFRVFSLVLIVQAVLFYSASRSEGTPLARPLAELPLSLGNWIMTSQGIVDAETQAVLRADDTVTRMYALPNGVAANLFIAYFKTQRAGQAPHSPKNCLPGAGFQPVESGRIDVPVGGNKSININRFVVASGNDESVVLYWYQSQGRAIADEFAAKFYLIEDSIRRHRSDTSLVRVVVPVRVLTRQQASDAAVSFVQAAYPVVSTWIPQ
jgi:EpsI family protein